MDSLNVLCAQLTRDLFRIGLVKFLFVFYSFLSRRSHHRERLSASMLSICLFVCLSVAKMQKNAIFSKLI